MKRTDTQARLGEPAHAAIARAKANEKGTFTRAPGAIKDRRRKRSGKSGGGRDSDELVEWFQDLFGRDTLRDDGKHIPHGELQRIGAERIPEDVAADLARLIKAGKADSSRPQQGGIVATKKGRVVKWLVPAERVKGKGQVAPSNARAAARQADRWGGMNYAERVDKRIGDILRGYFHNDSPELREAAREGFKLDRRARKWRVPNFRSAEEYADEGED